MESVQDQVQAIPEVERVCGWHDDHTPEGEPCGTECGSRATHVLLWTWPRTGERRWSFGCADHIGPPGIDPSGTHGWVYVALEL